MSLLLGWGFELGCRHGQSQPWRSIIGSLDSTPNTVEAVKSIGSEMRMCAGNETKVDAACILVTLE